MGGWQVPPSFSVLRLYQDADPPPFLQIQDEKVVSVSWDRGPGAKKWPGRASLPGLRQTDCRPTGVVVPVV